MFYWQVKGKLNSYAHVLGLYISKWLPGLAMELWKGRNNMFLVNCKNSVMLVKPILRALFCVTATVLFMCHYVGLGLCQSAVDAYNKWKAVYRRGSNGCLIQQWLLSGPGTQQVEQLISMTNNPAAGWSGAPMVSALRAGAQKDFP